MAPRRLPWPVPNDLISSCWTSCCPNWMAGTSPRSWRRTTETREIPIVFLSARSESGDQVRGHGTGGVGYITKPFDPLAMTDTVRDALEARAPWRA